MFCPSSDYSHDTIHNGFDEDQMEAIAKLHQGTNVIADERFPVDFNVHEKLKLSIKEISDSLMELESDMSRTKPAISASVDGRIPEVKRKLPERDQGAHMLRILAFVVKHLNLSGILKDLYFYCNGSGLTIVLSIGTQMKFYVQEEATRFTPSI